MNVLSYFDGLSCGRIALEKAGINVSRYYSCEIEKQPIQVANKNYPQDKQYRLGSVTDIDFSKLPKIDMLIGGSPCQNFSFAGKMKGLSTKNNIKIKSLERYLGLKEKGFEFEGSSYLFWEYVLALKTLKPKFFLLENVVMKREWEDVITDTLGVKPILINSALVSAQNRKRLYWTNINGVVQPEDKGIVLKDILEDDNTSCGAIRGRYDENGNIKQQIEIRDDNKTNTITTVQKDNVVVLRDCKLKEFDKDSLCHHIADATDIKGNDSIKRVYSSSGKSPTLNTCGGGNREPKVLVNESATTDDKSYCLTARYDGAVAWNSCQRKQRTMIPVSKSDVKEPNTYNGVKYRKLTPLECERLQCIPDNYTAIGVDENEKEIKISNSARYKMIGNGFTVDVIAHIFSFIKNGVTTEKLIRSKKLF